MKLLRTGWRLGRLLVWTVGTYGFLRLSALVLGLGRGGWSSPTTAAWRTRLFRRWSSGVLRILNVDAQVEGVPPQGPFFLVSNHLGYLDVPVLAAQASCVFVSKADVADWPGIGTICRAVDTLFIDRGSKRDIPRVMRGIGRVLDSGRGVVVFPEGSSTKGDRMLRFKPSLLESAASAGIPVSYAALSYRTPEDCAPAHLAVCWWDDMPFVGHFWELLGLRSIQATVNFGPQPILERDRKVLAQRLQTAVEQRFQPVI